MKKKSVKKNAFSYGILILIILGIMYFASGFNSKEHKFSYSEFVEKMESGEVTEVKITPSQSAGVYMVTGKLKDYGKKETFYVQTPLTDSTIQVIYQESKEHTFKILTMEPQAAHGYRLWVYPSL